VSDVVVPVHGSFPAAVLWPGAQPSEGGCGEIRAFVGPGWLVEGLRL
jgi:hypothetical protein